MTIAPGISVIIPYRAEAALAECVAAVRRSADIEIIVVVDAPPDGAPPNGDPPTDTAALAERLGCRVIRMEKRSGAALCRNAGAAAAKNEILLFLDAAVVLRDDALPRILKGFEETGCDALVGRYAAWMGKRGFFTAFQSFLTRHEQVLSARRKAGFRAGIGAVKRDVFLKIGPFNVRGCADAEFGCDMARAGCKTVVREDVVGERRHRIGLFSYFAGRFRRAAALTELALRKKGGLKYCAGIAGWRVFAAVPLCYAMALTALMGLWWWPGTPLSVLGALLLTVGLYRGFYKMFGKERGFLWGLLFGIPAFYTHVITMLIVPFAVFWGAMLFLFAPRRARA